MNGATTTGANRAVNAVGRGLELQLSLTAHRGEPIAVAEVNVVH
jgi:hypothetical protein